MNWYCILLPRFTILHVVTTYHHIFFLRNTISRRLKMMPVTSTTPLAHLGQLFIPARPTEAVRQVQLGNVETNNLCLENKPQGR